MREILFRGKRVDNGEWETSYNPNATMVCGVERVAFDPATVGQYTGLTDKNGKRIFEGDVIKTCYANTKKADFVEQVVFRNGRFCSQYEFSEGGKMWAPLPDGVPHHPQDKTPYMEWCEVIGNIHDNPELLGGTDHGQE